MRAELAMFPRGLNEGLPCVRLDLQGQPIDREKANDLLARHATPGARFCWLTGVDRWDEPGLREWLLEAQTEHAMPCVGIRKHGALDWPGSGCDWILDASQAVRRAGMNTDRLIDLLSDAAHSAPAVDDLFIELAVGQVPPSVEHLEILREAVEPQARFIYLAPGYRWEPLVLRAVAGAFVPWCVRRITQAQVNDRCCHVDCTRDAVIRIDDPRLPELERDTYACEEHRAELGADDPDSIVTELERRG